MKFNSILRTYEMKEFKKLSFAGEVLDLGGEKKSQYLKLVSGNFSITTVNFSKRSDCDVFHDLEKSPLPFKDQSFDVVVINNTLEHIYNIKQLILEASRVLKVEGRIVITVPFLFPVHPSPNDYWRFTDLSIENMLKNAGINKFEIKALASGVSVVSFSFFERLLPHKLQIFGYVLRPIAYFADVVIYSLRKKGSKQKKEYYTLGYFVIGVK